MSLAEAMLGVLDRDAQRIARGWIDPAEPFLADHQPGGHPLLGTVGGLEVLAGIIAAAGDLASVVAIEAVEAIRPIVAEGREPKPVTARWSAHSDGRVAAALFTESADGETVHVRCVFVTRRDDTPPVDEHRRDQPPHLTPDAVNSDQIYSVFFHGPTFRVVAQAQSQGKAMVTALASPLPSWSTDANPTLIAPRVIEFGLQTAGLLQLALDGAMMIPRHIDRIDRYRATDVGADSLFAVARRTGSSPTDPIDIDIVDAHGEVHVAVTGYRCVPLPFPTDNARLTALADRLRHSDRDRP